MLDFDKPLVLPEDIAVIMSYYPFGAVIDCQKLGGIPNTTYKVVTERETVAVRVYSHGQSSLEHIELEVKVLEHLAKMDFESPRLLPGLDGRILQQWRGYWVCATKFIPGVMADTVQLVPELVSDVGRLVASFQNAMSEFCIDTIPEGEAFLERGVEVLGSLDAALSHRGWDVDICNVLPMWERASKPFTRHGTVLNSNIIHADIWPSNVICKGDRVVGLVDFDDCLYGATIIDVAIALMEFSMFRDVVMGKELAMAFLCSYFRHGGRMSQLEEELVLNAMEMTCAMWVGYYIMQSPTFEEGEVYLRRLDSLWDDTYRKDMSSGIKHLISVARTQV